MANMRDWVNPGVNPIQYIYISGGGEDALDESWRLAAMAVCSAAS